MVKIKKQILFALILFLFAAKPLSAQVNTIYQGSFGMQLTGGEVSSSLLHGELYYNYNRWWDHEWTAKLRSDFQSSEGKEVISKHLASLRYGKSITNDWYWFSRLDGEKDSVRDLDARYGLVAGLGRWFSDERDFSFFLEASAGRYSDHLTGQTSEDYGVIQFREEFDKKLLETLLLYQEAFVTNLKDGHRYVADLGLDNFINSHWGLGFSFNYDLAIYEDGTRQEDTTFIMELRFNYEIEGEE